MRRHSFFSRKILVFPLIFLTGALLFAQTPQDDYDELEALLNSIIQNQEAAEEEPVDIIEIEEDVEQETLVQESVEQEETPEEETEESTTEETLPPDETAEEPADETTAIPEEQPEQEPAKEKETHKYEALAMIRYKNNDAVSFRLKLSVAPGPYILGLAFSSGYTAYKLIQPFYFGGFIEPHIGFPQKDFPYKYQMNGSSISSPLIVGGKLYMPFGICVFPFQRNIEFFVDIAPGLVFNMLWNTKFGGDSISSKLYTGFYASLRTGASYKNFSVFLEGNYDAILGFGFSIGIGYSLNISYERKIDEIVSLE